MSNIKMFAFGPLAPSMKDQGVNWLTDTEHALYDRMLQGLYAMLIQRIMTEKEYERALDRLWKKVDGLRNARRDHAKAEVGS